MKKSDLKTGMRIKLRNGWEAITMLLVENEDGFGDTGSSWLDLKNFDKNFLYPANHRFDIMKIWECNEGYKISDGAYKGKLIYEREEENMITIKGKKYSEETIHEALKNHIG